ncbi:MAG TPA: alpha-amylase family glycosyl hydrolase [Steroidobacteraceae bacterium]|nr:alpha-amylase family glycosyl hydrolase [Steroidobacteraceae bacterium]
MRLNARPTAAWRLCASALLASFCLGAAARPPASVPDVSHESARASAAWIRDGVIYEIFPRDFSAAGNLAGVTAQLDRLQQLGVTILWLMPIHPIGELHRKGPFGSPYAVRDYAAINPQYGTADDLHALVRAAHQHGMKLIIDMVANHTSWDSVMMRDPAFYKHENGRIVPPEPDWDDVAQLDYDNPRLREYMIAMLSKWVRDFDLDGFRCDAAAYVPTSFWEEARAALERVKPDIIMLAEADQPDLLVRAFDVDYDWTLHGTLERVIYGVAPASELVVTWRRESAHFPHAALHMRFSDNHDQRRAITRFGERAALAASALMFTLDGVPMLYNGMEVGDAGESTDPALFERVPIYWESGSGHLRRWFTPFYQGLIALRRTHVALTAGEVVWLENSDPGRVLTFLRRAPGETILVAINLSNQPFDGTVRGAEGGISDITPAALQSPARPAAAPSPRPQAAPAALSLEAWGLRIYRATPGAAR